ncbi:hypothetical protein EUX98_g4973 [Antrodiella citrinella]|uniref:Uncharacterized protein n=1 Tax=Antrodiella citrinella TaxID=2447956 RepID=A0A4S4MVH8_9APHY|nr:hypothetical protein EUX98_g4973 [Antrodiella citrinella]
MQETVDEVQESQSEMREMLAMEDLTDMRETSDAVYCGATDEMQVSVSGLCDEISNANEVCVSAI